MHGHMNVKFTVFFHLLDRYYRKINLVKSKHAAIYVQMFKTGKHCCVE